MGTQEKSKTKKPDRRAERSKRLMLEAMRELILEKGPSNISVTDIVERADVGRATFYAHFEDLPDFHRYMFQQLWAGIELELEASLAASEVPVGLYQSLIPSLAIFRVVAEKQIIFKRAVNTSGTYLADMIEPLAHRLEVGLKARELAQDSDEIPQHQAALFLASALVAMLAEWILEDMPETPETMDAIYQALAEPTLKYLTST
ncbi:MAG: TetR/AcrR family transcriptional regulator [Chloroflexi bacterium]|nr:TetR/AcrR family transcriptional regulator [Chloroflexota bacterium]